MTRCLAPLRPQLDELDQQGAVRADAVPDSRSPQQRLEDVYGQFEAAIMDVFELVVGYKQPAPNGHSPVPWWTQEVADAYEERNDAYEQLNNSDDADIEQASETAAEKRLRFEEALHSAKQYAGQQLAALVMDRDSKVRHAALRRYTPSTISPLTGIVDEQGVMPVTHVHSLNNLRDAFIRSSIPPPLDPTSPMAGPMPGPTSDPQTDPDAWARYDPPDPREAEQAALAARAAQAANEANSDTWVFTAAEVAVQTRRRTKKTAAGPDAILPLFLAYGGTALYAALASIFNYSWRHSVTPQAWREANVTALYKGKGSRSDPLSYRPISVTSGIVRTFEHVIHNRLAVSVGPQLARSQFGFRANHSTSDAILQLLTSLQYLCNQTGSCADNSAEPDSNGERGAKQARRNRKLRCGALFLDIQKAFDRVDHHILLARLHNIGVRGASWRWIRSFLTDRRVRCVDNQHESGWRPVEYGVPQGCVLSPLLFLVFINGLVTRIEASPDCSLISAILYADDGVLGPKLKACRDKLKFDYNGRVDVLEAEYGRQLKAAAELLDAWCTASRMRFGQEKTQVVIFNRGDKRTRTHTNFTEVQLCGYTVAIADDYEYLGLTLSHDLQWKKHTTRMRAKARAAATRVTNAAVNARPPQPAIVRELVRSCIIPAYDYAIEYWGGGLTKAERTSLQAAAARPLRAALGLPSTTHQHSTLWGYGVPGLRTHIQHKQLQHLRRLARLQTSHPDHPTVALYRLLNEELLEEHHRQLNSKAAGAVPTALYLLTALLPHTLDQPPAGLPHHPSPSEYWERVDAAWRWSAPDNDGLGGVSSRHREQQRAVWTAGLAALRDPAIHERLHATRRAAARREWESTHMPQDQAGRNALSATQLASCTAAPIRHCAPVEDDTPHPTRPPLHFLHRHHMADARHDELVRRARLLYDRSYTAAARLRFPSPTEVAITTARCTHGTCTENETVGHILVRCPRHEQERQQLRDVVQRCRLPLNFRTILNPPANQGKAAYRALYAATNAFLNSTAATRAQLGLPSLDTRPAPPPPPHLAAQPAGPSTGARRRALRQAALAAPAAPAPLDTG
jgi:hypothetical protein